MVPNRWNELHQIVLDALVCDERLWNEPLARANTMAAEMELSSEEAYAFVPQLLGYMLRLHCAPRLTEPQDFRSALARWVCENVDWVLVAARLLGEVEGTASARSNTEGDTHDGRQA